MNKIDTLVLPTLEGRNFELDKMSQELIREKISVKQRSVKSSRERKLSEEYLKWVFIDLISLIFFHQCLNISQKSWTACSAHVREHDAINDCSRARPAAAWPPSSAEAAVAATHVLLTQYFLSSQSGFLIAFLFWKMKQKERHPIKEDLPKTKKKTWRVDLESQTSVTNRMDPDGVLSKMEKLPRTDTAKMKGRRLFAPEPLDGLKTYLATPVTPRGTTALTPRCTWGPVKTEVDKTQAAKEILAQKYQTYSLQTVHQDSNQLQYPLGYLTVGDTGMYILNRNETTTKNLDGFPIKEVPSLEINEDQKSQSYHNVLYFRTILPSETEKLTSYCLDQRSYSHHCWSNKTPYEGKVQTIQDLHQKSNNLTKLE
ncbi:hypothetical protein HPG69_011373 [Diceros bicornis minor]|uniref:Uncharacterized protein n=1 Tax=Diceros bicornis minor TaxID=77932 RepID=A0A7J7FF07_DICBM|nr:hypothetical protein HPG69_011373 [Diceros bicornis minor]